MKIQCDVCTKHEASIFCAADEAALCDACDHRVHRANKLASKHHRFSLLRASPKNHPLCDVCQEKRAFVFCQQDRAILCRDCDVSIHSANELTLKHDRFLLTAVKVSPSPMVLPNNPSSSSPSSTTAPSSETHTSTISEYLIDTLPGWKVDDFLDSYSVPLSFSKSQSEDVFGVFDDGDVGGNFGIWVPQAPPPLICSSQLDQSETKDARGNNRSRLKKDHGFFTVPQISPGSNAKRPRTFLC